jgi:SAM-dependent methyltransferase
VSGEENAMSDGDMKSETLDPQADVREVVREKYGAIAAGEAVGCCSAACGCNGGDVSRVLSTIGYSEEQSQAIPAEANFGLGCGNPLAFAAIEPGDVVLDLGSGGGLDVFLAARAVGPEGRAIGVDMTPAMIERARAAAAKHGYRNVEFRLGEIEHLPVADASVDLVISNCVVNLSPDKARVFRETQRVLEPGGMLMVSDLVLRSSLTAAMQRSVDLYVGCVAGAALRDEYLRLIRDAGFTQVEVVKEGSYDVGLSSLPPESPERAAFDAVLSITVKAIKPS